VGRDGAGGLIASAICKGVLHHKLSIEPFARCSLLPLRTSGSCLMPIARLWRQPRQSGWANSEPGRGSDISGHWSG